MRAGILVGGLIGLTASAALAESTVELSRAVFVERVERMNSGQRQLEIEPASTLRRGDKVILVVDWRAPRGADGFSVSSPIPRTLAFQRAGSDEVQVSVDGGRKWGRLGEMRLRDADGIRLASPEDVTHLRWEVAENDAARGRGRFTYSALVR